MDNKKLMSAMLPFDKVAFMQVEDIASIIAEFHAKSRIVYINAGYDLTSRFDDLNGQVSYLSKYLSSEITDSIEASAERFRQLSKQLTPRLLERVNLGFFRDCHGDLHSGNIFLMKNPVLFDRIEFDPGLREIDVLNEIAFLCMDLEYFGQPDLSNHFFENYNLNFPAVLTSEDRQLFLFYKGYRANVCAKVNSLKSQCVSDERLRLSYLEKVRRYLKDMSIYLGQVSPVTAEKVVPL
ncbi:MAG: hypothetical protein EOO02_16070 [Chitinophagaceae bacterium]|nr:MAG: hypothetical protein EOO02_16070 [Chitinophagaceae bacterium]